MEEGKGKMNSVRLESNPAEAVPLTLAPTLLTANQFAAIESVRMIVSARGTVDTTAAARQ